MVRNLIFPNGFFRNQVQISVEDLPAQNWLLIYFEGIGIDSEHLGSNKGLADTSKGQ